jgi:succinate-acetate transporter protein
MTHANAETAAAQNGQNATFWRSHTQISLQPVAAPSILGLFGFAAATFMVAANLAGWYGTAATPLILFPFALIAGGLAQFLAGMWSFRARDGLATAMHGMWGSFWLAYGLFWTFVTLGRLPAVSISRTAELGFGYWFIVLAAITWVGALAALARTMALALTLAVLAAGSTILAIAWAWPVAGAVKPAGDVLVAAAVIAFYTASALMLEGSFQRPVLPVGQLWPRIVRGGSRPEPIQYAQGEPGVKVGQ